MFCALFSHLGLMQAQELKCSVSINADRVVSGNLQIVKTLERSLYEFVNKTKWTSKEEVNNTEKISCSMFINISEMNNDQFRASIQVQSSRPIYGSSYDSSSFNFNDNDFTFSYIEFDNLFFDPNGTNTNLVAVIAFYVHVILGIDADTYAIEGGTKYFQVAQTITDLAQQTGFKGWKQADGNQTRFFLINDMLSTINIPFRQTMYQYHRLGLDMMSESVDTGKENAVKAIKNLDKIYNARPNAFLLRVFFDTKSDEITQLLKDGPKVNLDEMKELLNRLSPINISKWQNLR